MKRNAFLIIALTGLLLSLVYVFLRYVDEKPSQKPQAVLNPSSEPNTPVEREPVPFKEQLNEKKISPGQPSVEALKQSDWWNTVRKKIHEHQYHLNKNPSDPGEEIAYQAPSRSRNFIASFTSRGLKVESREDADQPWHAEVTATGWGRGDDIETLSGLPDPLVHESRISYARGGLTEWYENRPEGIEQGFSIADRPAGDDPLVLQMQVAGNVRPAFLTPGKIIDFFAQTGERVLRCSQLVVFDARQRLLDSHFELAAGLIRIVIDDRNAVYPLTVDPLFTDPAWTAVGEQNVAYFSYSISTAGDVNGDGYSDVIVGAPQYDTASADEGAVFLFFGSPNGPSPFISWIGPGDQSGSYFGSAVATAGDVNGDGFSDVAVGAHRYDNGANARGRVFVYYGTPQGPDNNPDIVLVNDTSDNPNFGISVGTAGYVNDDDYSDLIVGADGRHGIVTTAGRAYVYHGSFTGLDTSPAWIGSEGGAEAGYGGSVGTAGDVDGDGYSDVIVGSSRYGSDEGRAYVYYGSSSGITATGRWIADSYQTGAYFGNKVATAGDVNGDGFSDVIVGSYRYSNVLMTEDGKAFVYYGSASGLAMPASADWTVSGSGNGNRLGQSTGTAGDVNGDGYADIMVSAGVGDDSTGQVLVFHGSAGGLNVDGERPSGNESNADWNHTGAEQGDFFGYAVSTAGDVNGDGISDILIGSHKYDSFMDEEGRAYVFMGAPAGLSGGSTPHATGSDDEFLGMSLAPAGDVNGDGYADVIVGAPNNRSGGGKIYIFHGTADGLGLSPVWSAASGRCAGFYGCDEFGISVGTAGDVNGDGFDDIIVGTSENYNPQENLPGMAVVYHGSPTGLSNNYSRPSGTLENADWVAQSNQERAYFGVRVATAGDVNGDGYSDVIVGAPYYDNGQIDEGRVFVFYGSPGGLAADPAWSAEPNQVKAGFGFPVNSAGDVNGDGYSDVIVGAIWFEDGEANEGKVYLFHGSAGGLSTAPDWSAESNTPYAYLGYAVTSAGDVNGDGFNDVIVGAYGDGDFTGRALVFHGSSNGLSPSVNWSAVGTVPSGQFGRLVNCAGDLNGDGFGDVMIGAPENGPGEVSVFYGSPTGLDSRGARPEGSPANADFTAAGGDSDRWFGLTGTAAGDVNGDGYSDMVIGSPEWGPNPDNTSYGAVYLYYGNGGDVLYERPRQYRTTGSTPVAHLGKSNSETVFNIAMPGRSPLGRTKTRLEWEVKPPGVPFDGMDTIVGELWHDTGTGSVLLQAAVDELVGHTAYHWRARIRYPAGHALGNVAGPWMVPFPGIPEVSDLRTDNSAPAGGYIAAHVIPTDSDQIVQATDGSGIITVGFRISDPGTNLCSLHSFAYSIDGGSSWHAPAGADGSPALGGSWPDNSSALYSSKPDWSGEIHAFTFNTKLMPNLQNMDLSSIRVRFVVNDGQLDSLQPVVSNAFRVDNAYPTGTIDIEGDTYTDESLPLITISGVPGETTHMRFALADESNLADADWVAYQTTFQDLELGSDNGPKVVYAEFKDAFGNVQPATAAYAQDDIIFDSEPPLEGNLIIDDNEGHTNTGTLQLNLNAFDLQCPTTGLEMRFAVNGTYIGSWMPFAASHTLDICTGGCPPEGETVVQARFRDAAGNTSDIPVFDTTIYDTTLIVSFFNIESDYCVTNCYTNNPSPVLISEVEGADFMQFALSSGGLSGAPMVPYANLYYTEGLLTDPQGDPLADGPATIHARYRDMAGNVQNTSTTVILDTQPPGAVVTATAQWASGNALSVPYDPDADPTDASGVAATTLYYKRGWDTFWQSASLAGVTSPLNFTDLSGDGYYYFWASSGDHVGNSDGGPPTIDGPPAPLPEGVYRVLFETAKPTSAVTHIALNDATAEFTITYTHADASGEYTSGVKKVDLWVKKPGDPAYSLAATDEPAGSQIVYQAPQPSAPEGAYHFYTVATDNAGNVEAVPAQGYDMLAIYSSEFSGYAIVAVGSIAGGEGLDAHTQTANHIYAHLINRNFALVDDPIQRWDDPLDLIKYFNPYAEPQPGEDDYSEGGTVSYWDALRKAITEWALDKMMVRPGPLYLILVDHGTENNFHLTGTQNITPTRLDEWIDSLETDMAFEGIDEDIIIVLGTCYSGSFIDELTRPGTRRVIVASAAADEPSYRGPQEPGGVRDGEFFTSALFNSLGQGFDLNTSFTRAVQLTEIHTDSGLTDSLHPVYQDTARQHPLLEDDGSGGGSNTLSGSGDGAAAAVIELGFGTDADLVRIDPANFGTDLSAPLGTGETTATFWAKLLDNPVVAPDVDRAWVEIRSPGIVLQEGVDQQTVDLIEVPLEWNAGTARYEAAYTAFTEPGRYTLFFYVNDDAGITSSFERAFVYKTSPDPNLPPGAFSLHLPTDNSALNASAGVVFGWSTAVDPDDDPVTYTLEIRAGAWADANLFYRIEGLVKTGIHAVPPTPFADPGAYTWRVTAVDQYGNTTDSAVWGFTVDNTNTGAHYLFEGYVRDVGSNDPVVDAQIQATHNLAITPTNTNGWFMGAGEQGNYDFTINASSYATKVSAGIPIPTPTPFLNFYLTPLLLGDLNGDADVDLADAVLALQTLVGIEQPEVDLDADVNGDDRIGPEELIFILQKVSGLRD